MGTTDTLFYVSGYIMSCNYPLIAKRGELLPSGKYKYIPIARYDSYDGRIEPDMIKVPCGKCLGCRADYTRKWADRMILELDHSKKAVFCTLTYDNDHLPVLYQVTTGQTEMTLNKRDYQLFMKRLRKRFRDKEIRVYATGEYGVSSQRPHYHLILFGLGLDDFPDLQPQGMNELGHKYYRSDWLAQNVWKNGFCLLAEVSYKTCAYVAKYVRKKQFGLYSDEFIDRMRSPVFCESSRNPGIGMYYPVEHPDFAEKSKYYFSDQNGSVEVHFPDAFLRWLGEHDPELADSIKNERKSCAQNSEMLKLFQTDLSSMDLYEMNEKKLQKTEAYIDSFSLI